MIRYPIRNPFQDLPMLTLLCLVTFSGCRKTQPGEAVLSYQEKYDQSYGTGQFGRYDLFLPEGRSRDTRVIILIHGGAWVGGVKEYCDSYAQRFAESGFAAVSMNYRLANDSVHYNEMLDDIDSMICCIRRHSDAWGIGNGRMALFGYSAGGHLALLYAYSADRQRNIGTVISLAGPTDIQDTLLWKTPGLYEDIRLMTGDSLPENWGHANPVCFTVETNPATLLIHGTTDSVVPVSQSIKLCHVLKATHARVKLRLFENETHYFPAGATEKFLEEAKHFLDETLK
jgi:acetyl esterase/lipase